MAREMTEPLETLLLTNVIVVLLTVSTQAVIFLYFGVKLFKYVRKPCRKMLGKKKKQKEFKVDMQTIEMTEDE